MTTLQNRNKLYRTTQGTLVRGLTSVNDAL